MNRFRHVVTAELTKIATIRSTKWALLLTLLICTSLGCAVSLSLRAGFPRLPAQQRRDFDPLFATFYSLSIGQLALVVFGVTVTGGEYSTGMIATSLLVVPRRGLFYAAKIAAGLLAAAATALVAVTATFFAAQQALGPHRVSVSTPGTLQAALGACLYLTLICAIAMGITAVLRSPAMALAIMMPLLFLDSQGLGNVPGLGLFIDYLPDQAGAVIMHLRGTGGRFGRPFGPWTGTGTGSWTPLPLGCPRPAAHPPAAGRRSPPAPAAPGRHALPAPRHLTRTPPASAQVPNATVMKEESRRLAAAASDSSRTDRGSA